MTVSVRLNDNDSKLIKSYASVHGISVSEAMRRAIIERIEDEYDLKAFDKAMAEFKKNPVTYSHEDIMRELALDD